MDHSVNPMLAPVVALVCWTLVVQGWMLGTRIPALARKGISLKGRRGGRGTDLDGVIEPQTQWKAHNYNHLMEQPTLFYAIALTTALIGLGGGIAVALAWAYVVLRVAHSLVQATTNIVAIRFALYLISSLMLIGLALLAAAALLGLN